MIKYNPITYWNKRENPNNKEGENPARIKFDVDYISRHTRNENKILELGPGIGRTISAYNESQNITTLDISHKYSTQLTHAIERSGLSVEQKYLTDLDCDFEEADGAYEVGVCCQVLLHIPPQSIAHMLSEMIRVCSKIVIITSYKHGTPVISSRLTHVFNHDYITLCTELGCVMNDVIMNDGRICFVINKKRN